MTDTGIRVCRTVTLVYTVPFWLRCACKPNAATRVDDCTRWASRLNDLRTAGRWRVESPGLLVPSAVRARKKVFLVCDDSPPEVETQFFGDLLRINRFDPQRIEQTTVLLDHGLGVIEWRFQASLPPSGQLAHLTDAALGLRAATMDTLGSAPTVARLAAIETALQVAYSEKHQSHGPYLKPANHRRGARVDLDVYAMGLILTRDEGTSSVTLQVLDLAEFASTFCGQRWTADAMRVDWPGTPLFAAGYNGFVALEGATRVPVDTGLKIRWLARLATASWGGLYELSEELHDQIMPFVITAQMPRARSLLTDIRDAEAGIATLEQEGDPVNVCGDALDEAVYAGIWRAWRGDQLMQATERIARVVNQHVTDLERRAADATKRRVEGFLVALAALSLLGVMFDIGNFFAWPNARMLWVAAVMEAALITVAGTLWFVPPRSTPVGKAREPFMVRLAGVLERVVEVAERREDRLARRTQSPIDGGPSSP